MANWVAVAPDELPKVLFHRLDEERVQRALTMPEDEDAAALIQFQYVWDDRLYRQNRLADPGQGAEKADPPHYSTDPRGLG